MNIHIFCPSATLLIQLTWVSKIESTVISIRNEDCNGYKHVHNMYIIEQYMVLILYKYHVLFYIVHVTYCTTYIVCTEHNILHFV